MPADPAPSLRELIEQLTKAHAEMTKRPWLHGYPDGSGRAEPAKGEGGHVLTEDGTAATGYQAVSIGGRDSWGIPIGIIRPEDADGICETRNMLPAILSALAQAERDAAVREAATAFVQYALNSPSQMVDCDADTFFALATALKGNTDG